MNSKERFFAVLNGEIPDRVPSFELLIDEEVRKKIHPELDFYEFQRAIGFDMILFGLGSSEEPLNWIDRKKKIFRDKWGVLQQFTSETMPHQIGDRPHIDNMADMDSYIPPDPAHPAIIEQVRKVVNRYKGDMSIGYLGEATFAVQQYLRGSLDNLMMDYAFGDENGELVKRIAKMAADYYSELYRNIINEGVEVIVLGDDYAGKAGPFMSPEHFCEYILPGLKQVVKTCKDSGAYVIKHCDGDLWKIFDMMVDTGIDAFGPLEPLPTMQLSRIKKAYPHITVIGNVDVDLLCIGSADEVVERTKKCLQDAMPGGRFILSSGNSIISAVKPELYLAMIEAKNKYGNYL